MCKQVATIIALFGLQAAGIASAPAGEADVLAAEVVPDGEGSWRFTVTVKHGDEGWDHYANRFEIIGSDGAVLGVRTLFHPHVTEQPFTRSLGNVRIGNDVKSVIIRAHDSVHESGGKELIVKLPR